MSPRWLSLSLLCGALAAGLLVSPPAAQAETSDADKAQARELVGEGLKALRAGDFAAAYRAFSSADKLYHAPTTLLGVARAQAGLGHLVAAQEAYNRLVREELPPNPSEAFVNALADGKKELAALTPRIPTVVIEVRGPSEPEVTLDGELVSSGALGFKRPVDPGKHVVVARAAGYGSAQREFTAVEGKAAPESVTLTMTRDGSAVSAPAPGASSGAAVPGGGTPGGPSEPGRREVPTASYVAWGVGGAGLVVGVVAGVMAMSKKGELDDACRGSRCPPSASSIHDAYTTRGLVSTIGFVTAVVGGGAGAALYFMAPGERQTGLRVAPVVGLGSFGLQGAF